MNRMDFAANYATLNPAQKQAVDLTDGPVLVIAGPGTGKTQLLSLRVANILAKTDTLPQNILCLTFTESGALNMRERLTRFIGKAAYDVNIATYHTFGSELIQRFPEYFAETRLQRPIDELGKYHLIASLVEQMSYTNPLKQTQHHLGDLIATISELKRALMHSSDLGRIIAENQTFITNAQPFVAKIMQDFGRMPNKLEQANPYFRQLLKTFKRLQPAQPVHPQFASLAELAAGSLAEALGAAEATAKTKPLTEWKNKWLAKNNDNQFILHGELENRRMHALGEVLEAYETTLEAEGFYDFDDMILRAIKALETNPDLKFSLQEQYLYILLDEFQDTNAAQLKLVELLTDNPVNNGQPNVLAVGDDDQAIYAFQGAEYSNMLDFHGMFRNVAVISLTENYRSTADILHVAHNIAEQIEHRLHHHFSDISKALTAASTSLPATSHIARHEFLSDIAQNSWIAREIKKLIDSGTHPKDIAVLAPKHKYLEPLVPYINKLGVPVKYEKRENILEAPIVMQLIAMAQLVLSLQAGNHSLSNSLWPQVLSFDCWGLPTSTIWRLSWQMNDDRGKQHWSEALLDRPDTRRIALLFLALAGLAASEPLENMFDYLTGITPVEVHESDESGTSTVTSPLKQHYIDNRQHTDADEFYHTLSHLRVLRAKLREHQEATETTLRLADLLHFVDLYKQAGQQLVNTSPYAQAADAVQLMTVFKAKGLEFEHVFLPNCHDDVWGESARGQHNKLTLPPNLMPIRHAGMAPDERLRLFFVAITRARFGLYLTSFLQTFSGTQTKRLKYLAEEEQADGSFAVTMLPEGSQAVIRSKTEAAPSLTELELGWQERHIKGIGENQLNAQLAQRLQKYALSSTHICDFIDLEHAGPQYFLLYDLLRFPKALSTSIMFGNAMHETLEWVQHQLSAQQHLPDTAAITDYFAICLRRKHLEDAAFERALERGQHALKAYFAARAGQFQPSDIAEQDFRHEGIVLGNALLTGKVDKLRVNRNDKTITVFDYKTGTSHSKWESTLKFHKYRLQLYYYKLLIEGSHSYHGYTVEKGVLEFVEPDSSGAIHTLELAFSHQEQAHLAALAQAVWQHIKALDFPDVRAYPPTLSGVKQFEQWLVESTQKAG